MTKRLTACLLATAAGLALALPAAAKDHGREQFSECKTVANYKVVFTMTTGVLESSGTVLTARNGEGEFAAGGSKALRNGEVNGKPFFELKDFASSASFRVYGNSGREGDLVLDCKLSLKGPVSASGPGTLEEELSFHGTVAVTPGKQVLLTDGPSGRITVTVFQAD